jgi:8-oxo-dGTP diphosphatase
LASRPAPPAGSIECATLHGGRRSVAPESLRWRVSAYGVAVRDGRVLLGRSAFTGLWDIPGGGVEPWETLVAGMVREFAEETGVVPEPGPLIHTSEGFFSIFQHAFHSLRYYYRVRLPAGAALTPDPTEVTSFAWVDPAAEPAGQFAPGDLAILDKALRA